MGQFTPATAMLNGSFDILRNGFDSRRVSNIQFANGFRNINRILGHSTAIIADYNRGGERNFWTHQVFPLT